MADVEIAHSAFGRESGVSTRPSNLAVPIVLFDIFPGYKRLAIRHFGSFGWNHFGFRVSGIVRADQTSGN